MEIETVNLSEIEIPSHFCRRIYDEEKLAELAASIQQLTLLEPIVVRKIPSGMELVDGSRRLKAMLKIGMEECKAVVLGGDETYSRSASLVANLQRDDLNPIEEAEAVRKMVEELKVGIPALSRLLSKSQDWIKKRLDILRLPAVLFDALGAGEVSIGVAMELRRIDDEVVLSEYTRHAVAGGCTTAMAKQWVGQWALDRDSVLRASGGDGSGFVPSGPVRTVLDRCGACLGEVPMEKIKILRICEHCEKEIRIALSGGGKEHG